MFKPGKLPGNEYAFKNAIFINDQQYMNFKQASGNREPIYIDMNGFVLLLKPLQKMAEDEFGASAF